MTKYRDKNNKNSPSYICTIFLLTKFLSKNIFFQILRNFGGFLNYHLWRLNTKYHELLILNKTTFILGQFWILEFKTSNIPYYLKILLKSIAVEEVKIFYNTCHFARWSLKKIESIVVTHSKSICYKRENPEFFFQYGLYK